MQIQEQELASSHSLGSSLSTQGLSRRRTALAIASVSLGTMLLVLDGALPTVALPTIATVLHATPSASVLLITVYQLVLVMALLPLSAMGERIGYRTLYGRGVLLFLLASVGCCLATSLPMLVAARIMQAIGAGAALSVSSALVKQIYPHHLLGRGLAFNSLIVSLAAVAAPALGGLLVSAFSWRAVFSVPVPIAILSLALARALPNPVRRRLPYDWPAAFTCAAAFFLIIAGFQFGVFGGPVWIAAGGIGAGTLMGYALTRHELKQPAPILPVDMLTQPVIGLSSLGALMVFTASSIVLVTTPFRLQHAFGTPPAVIGMMIAPWPTSILFVGPLAGMLSDRIPAAILGAAGMVVATVGLVSLAVLPATPTFASVAWRMGVSGAGFGLFTLPNARLILAASSATRTASAGGLISTVRLSGQMLGATAAAFLLKNNLGIGTSAVLISAFLCVVSGCCSLTRLSHSKQAKSWKDRLMPFVCRKKCMHEGWSMPDTPVDPEI